jgi:hypothetical protein
MIAGRHGFSCHGGTETRSPLDWSPKATAVTHDYVRMPSCALRRHAYESCATAAACFAGRPVEPLSWDADLTTPRKRQPSVFSVSSVAEFFVTFVIFVAFVVDRQSAIEARDDRCATMR